MAKDKKPKKPKSRAVKPDPNEKLEVVDRTVILKDLKISAGFVPLLQNVLLHILSQMEPEEIGTVYTKIDIFHQDLITNQEAYKSGEKKPPVFPHFEEMIHTLTTLISYLKGKAKSQGAVVIQDRLKIADLQEAVKALAEGDMEKFDEENVKIEKKMQLTNPATGKSIHGDIGGVPMDEPDPPPKV